MRVLISCDYSPAGKHVLQEAKKFLDPIANKEIFVYTVIDQALVTGTGLYDNSTIVQSLEDQAEEINKWGQGIFAGQEIHFSSEVGYPAERVV